MHRERSRGCLPTNPVNRERDPWPAAGATATAVRAGGRSRVSSHPGTVPRRPTTDHGRAATAGVACAAFFPRPSLVKQRPAREAPVLPCVAWRSSAAPYGRRTPHLALGAGGACGTAPGSVAGRRTLRRTPSPPGSCTVPLHSRLAIARPERPAPTDPRRERHVVAASSLRLEADDRAAIRAGDSNRHRAHVLPARAGERAPARGVRAEALPPSAVAWESGVCGHRIECRG